MHCEKWTWTFGLLGFIASAWCASIQCVDNNMQLTATNVGGLGGFQVVVPAYTFHCCGVITSWEAYLMTTQQGTDPLRITFQVWRLTGPSRYSLVGSNEFRIDGTVFNRVLLQPATENQVCVHPGDILGFQGNIDILLYVGNMELYAAPIGCQHFSLMQKQFDFTLQCVSTYTLDPLINIQLATSECCGLENSSNNEENMDQNGNQSFSMVQVMPVQTMSRDLQSPFLWTNKPSEYMNLRTETASTVHDPTPHPNEQDDGNNQHLSQGIHAVKITIVSVTTFLVLLTGTIVFAIILIMIRRQMKRKSAANIMQMTQNPSYNQARSCTEIDVAMKSNIAYGKGPSEAECSDGPIYSTLDTHHEGNQDTVLVYDYACT